MVLVKSSLPIVLMFSITYVFAQNSKLYSFFYICLCLHCRNFDGIFSILYFPLQLWTCYNCIKLDYHLQFFMFHHTDNLHFSMWNAYQSYIRKYFLDWSGYVLEVFCWRKVVVIKFRQFFLPDQLFYKFLILLQNL